jgi:hypothetical protein
MFTHALRAIQRVVACAATLGAIGASGTSEASQPLIEAALTNITILQRPGQNGLATVWDGNKYIQCRWMPERILRCEAAGELMQPSLGRVLSAERIARLNMLGWRLDHSFGNYVQNFPDNVPLGQVAEKILEALKEGYDADVADLDVKTDWVKSVSCPPRNGPSQNLAGMINDSPRMARTAVRGCSYKPKGAGGGRAAAGSKTEANRGPAEGRKGAARRETEQLARTADLIAVYGARVAGEIMRLNVNFERQIFFVLSTGKGYVQCGPQTSPPGVYCEAQSAESWSGLADILTPERVARLHAMGFADPGRSPNYAKSYRLEEYSGGTITEELLTILFDIYGYKGAPKLQFSTEKGREDERISPHKRVRPARARP